VHTIGSTQKEAHTKAYAHLKEDRSDDAREDSPAQQGRQREGRDFVRIVKGIERRYREQV